MAGILTVTGASAGLLSGAKTIGPVNMQGTAVVGTVFDGILASGDNTVVVPAGAVAFVLVLPATNAVQVKLRTNLDAADAGVPFGPTGFMVWPLYTGTTSLTLNAATTTTGIEISFI